MNRRFLGWSTRPSKFGRSSCQLALAFPTFLAGGRCIAHLVDLSSGKPLCARSATDIERSLLPVELKPDLDQATDGFGAGGGVVSFRPSRDFGQERFWQTSADRKIESSCRPALRFCFTNIDFAIKARRFTARGSSFVEIGASTTVCQRNTATASINSPKKTGSTIGGTSQSRNVLWPLYFIL